MNEVAAITFSPRYPRAIYTECYLLLTTVNAWYPIRLHRERASRELYSTVIAINIIEICRLCAYRHSYSAQRTAHTAQNYFILVSYPVRLQSATPIPLIYLLHEFNMSKLMWISSNRTKLEPIESFVEAVCETIKILSTYLSPNL